MSGTVEWNRLRLEIELISRELAGAFKPAVEYTTRALTQLRQGMEGMSKQQQNLLLLGGLILGGSAIGLSRVGLGLGAGALALGASRGSPAAVWAGMAGGAALGFKFGGPIGAGIGTAAGAAIGAPRHEGSERPFDYWRRLRGGGSDMATATAAMLGRSVAVLFGGTPATPGGGPSGPDPGRRRVTIADSGFESVGSARDRLNTKLALVDATTAGADKPITVESLLEDIKTFLETTFGTPAPALR